MYRLRFLFILTTLLLVGARASADDSPVGTASETETPPNIVLMIADDLTWWDVGCYGNPQIKTPHMDQLAQQGRRFTGMFTATAMCAPTRQQLYTGLFPVRNGAWPNHSRVFPGTKSLVHHLRSRGYRVGLAGKRHFGPPESFPFETVGGSQLNFDAIEKFVTKDRQQPFCLIVASHEPHLPWTKGDPTAYPPESLVIPPHQEDTPETRKALSKYYAEVTHFDSEVGRVLSILDHHTLAADTITVVTSEQGGQMPFGKWTLYDAGIKTAFIVRWPGQVEAGTTSKALCQYVDVVPTLLDAIDSDFDPPKTQFDGRSFLDVLIGKTEDHREFVYGVHTTRGIINGSESYPIRSIRTDRYKLIWNLNHEQPFENIATSPRGVNIWQSWKASDDAAIRARAEDYQHRPEFELYDIQADSFERVNLLRSRRVGDQREIMRKLHTELLRWMKSQKDEGLKTEAAATLRQGRGEKKRDRKAN